MSKSFGVDGRGACLSSGIGVDANIGEVHAELRLHQGANCRWQGRTSAASVNGAGSGRFHAGFTGGLWFSSVRTRVFIGARRLALDTAFRFVRLAGNRLVLFSLSLDGMLVLGVIGFSLNGFVVFRFVGLSMRRPMRGFVVSMLLGFVFRVSRPLPLLDFRIGGALNFGLRVIVFALHRLGGAAGRAFPLSLRGLLSAARFGFGTALVLTASARALAFRFGRPAGAALFSLGTPGSAGCAFRFALRPANGLRLTFTLVFALRAAFAFLAASACTSFFGGFGATLTAATLALLATFSALALHGGYARLVLPVSGCFGRTLYGMVLVLGHLGGALHRVILMFRRLRGTLYGVIPRMMFRSSGRGVLRAAIYPVGHLVGFAFEAVIRFAHRHFRLHSGTGQRKSR